MYRPGGQLPGRASVISGELQAGGNNICLCLTGELLLREGHPGQLAHTFVIRILTTSFAPKFQHSLFAFTLDINLCGLY
jgi:hypothetical protein